MDSVSIDLTVEELDTMQKRKGSVLRPYRDIVICCYKNSVPISEIAKLLKQKGVITTSENIRQYCKRHVDAYDNVEFVFSDKHEVAEKNNFNKEKIEDNRSQKTRKKPTEKEWLEESDIPF